ncbi:CPBP family intramembrane metalloprotease [Cyclobacterium sp. 1_MG-2023]|uniref:CPBP family intramembrane glutamic endopeptidase n=1 Tax=Cyclobacterium sp. 1_MG-2023 TaxID=3062681 RepID=UPI0026E1DAB5|nr:CPBP family intramembrane glutamic endopeptidase [Cyclobacterium sp. 1_MG-2023]MDO6439976.1 CPBP family intramembrane metalloprotease [Cyclobacterium sp. 1_MG-2023]
MQNIKISIPVLLVLAFTIGILLLPGQTNRIGIEVGKNNYINFQISYQLLLLGIAIISMISSYILNPESLKSILSIGNLSAVGEELKIFGIKKGDSWLKTGVSLSIFISLATGIFMYFQLKGQTIDYSLLKTGFLWIVLFSLTNSFAEEMIFRVGINAPLTNLLSPNNIFLISAVIFGVAHFQGMPSGIIGVILAGLLGYVLSKSIHETNGIFWAWLIHFLQDIIIIGSLYLLKSS